MTPRPSVSEDGEPLRRYALVEDRDGYLWRRGNTRWTCLAPVDGVHVKQVGRLGWRDLVQMYGPIGVVDLNDRGTR